MKPTRIRLVDLGFDDSFDASMSFAQSLIQSLGTETKHPVAEIEFIRTRDKWTIVRALQSEANVVHIMGHGDNTPESLGFWSRDDSTWVSLADLAEEFAYDGEGIYAGLLFADCCDSARGRFVNAVRDCIEQPLAYVGSKRSVGWHEPTTFASALYGALFRDRGRGLTPSQRGLQAANRAIEGYKAIMGRECPYKAVELRPSRKATRSLGPGVGA